MYPDPRRTRHPGGDLLGKKTELGTEALPVFAGKKHPRPVEGDGENGSCNKQRIVKSRPEQTLTSFDDAAKPPYSAEGSSYAIATPGHRPYFTPSIPRPPQSRKRKTNSARFQIRLSAKNNNPNNWKMCSCSVETCVADFFWQA